MIPLTKETIEAAYEYFRTTPPFNKWNLPEPEDIIFKVGKDRHTIGWHITYTKKDKRKDVLAVSIKCVGHTDTLLITVAHEMIHIYLTMTGQDKGGEHNAAFKLYASHVCKVHGFDPKAF